MNLFIHTDNLIQEKREIQKKMKGLDKRTKAYKDLDNKLKLNTKKWNDLMNNRK